MQAEWVKIMTYLVYFYTFFRCSAIIQQQMSQQLSKNKRNRYKVIDQDKRMEIVQRIINKREQLKTVSEDIGINVSTCKAIIKVYQQQGRVGKKKTRNKVVDVVQTYSFYMLENSKLTELSALKIMNSKVSVQQKQLVDDIIEGKCKEKAEKLLIDALEIHKKVQQAKKQTQTNNQNLLFNNLTNYYPYGFYQPL